ncbi:MAG TPA: YbdK family carboxylate-amine ligase [Conexibacter sp.]|jgi:carboxylate-amine ligase
MATYATLPNGAMLHRLFERTGGLTVGVEEEVMLLDPVTLDLAPVAREVLARLDGDARFKLELPAAQLEIATTPTPSALQAVGQLRAARRDLAAACDGLAFPAAAGLHPFAAPEGPLNDGGRYDEIAREYGPIARRQLVASLQVHVAVGGADRTLAVYNALRCFLPELAALAANAPFYSGVDSGLASMRPTLCQQLPRQGVPPRIAGWQQFADELRWGVATGARFAPTRWWWELRPHVRLGTLELRVPDAQTTVPEAAGVIAFAQALVATLADDYDAGGPLPDAPSWRIEENRWSALRHGLDGTLADLDSGKPVPTRERLNALVDTVEPAARRLGCGELLAQTRGLIERNGALRQRDAAAERGGVDGVAAWLAGRFLAGEP